MKSYKTHNIGELNTKLIEKEVKLSGWIHRRRDHGNIIFFDLRDRTGIAQVVFDPTADKKMHDTAEKLRNEYCVMITGKVRHRPEGTVNKKISTGEVEVLAETLTVLSPSENLPIEINDNLTVSDEVRFKHRYLDLRRTESLKAIQLRHKLGKVMRDFLDKEGFYEVETPILTKSTPEGARDFLVPSRLAEGEFYALPQSPQLFKQILMVSGLEKYFQIAKCFRDEDLRRDRQPEFTQLDLEMSFVDEDDIFDIIERLIKKIFTDLKNVKIEIPLKRISHQEAVERYGSDKPDLRFDMEITDLTDLVKDCEFKIYKEVCKKNGKVASLTLKGKNKEFSRKKLDNLTEFIQEQGGGGLSYLRLSEGKIDSPIAKFFDEKTLNAIKKAAQASDNDIIFIVADPSPALTNTLLGALRVKLAQDYGLIPEDAVSFLWVTDFPLFKYNDEKKRWESEHHPFTSPYEEDIKYFEKDPGKVRSKAYDIVVNGIEIGSGSIRIHHPDLQKKLFKVIGISEKEAESRFGFLLRAFKYGAPPHGGVALGFDRLLALIAGFESIRDVIPFPKTQRGICPLTDAPSKIDKEQLKELGLKII